MTGLATYKGCVQGSTGTSSWGTLSRLEGQEKQMDVGVALWIGDGVTDLPGISAVGHLDATVDMELSPNIS